MLRSLALILVPPIGYFFTSILYRTNKKVFHSPVSLPNEPIIFACWHGELLMLPYLYLHYRKTAHAKILISNHFDGALISKTVKHFGLETLAGSSNKNAVKVLIQAIISIKDGYDIGITPDGPKGPRGKVSDGLLFMAQKTKAKVVLINIKPTKYWQLNSWDQFVIPKPFGTLNYYATEAIDISSMNMQDAKQLIKEGLDKHEK